MKTNNPLNQDTIYILGNGKAASLRRKEWGNPKSICPKQAKRIVKDEGFTPVQFNNSPVRGKMYRKTYNDE